MRYNYFIQYSDGTIEKNVYPLTEQYVYGAMGKAIHNYLMYHKDASVVVTKIEGIR